MAITSVEHVANVLHLTSHDDPTLQQSYQAAEAQVASACRVPPVPDGETAPQALVMAVVLRTARLLARRDSPTGVLGVGELGPVRLARIDQDVEALEAPWRKLAFA